ncbi:MAG: fixJ [Schlesneria sp.]|nr:fixJ [Schlesneria sp.]
MDQHPEVYIVDDDPGARRALAVVVASMQLNAVECANAEDFLTGYTEDHPSCLITDLRMRGMSGLDLLRHLKAEGRVIPTVIVTGYAETPIAVDAMQAGAVTFLEKTAPTQKICDAITHALKLSYQLLAKKAERERIQLVWKSINTEERHILELVSHGKLNKEIAFEINVPLRTIEDRRRRLMAKIGATSVVDLIRFAVRLEELAEEGGSSQSVAASLLRE